MDDDDDDEDRKEEPRQREWLKKIKHRQRREGWRLEVRGVEQR